MNFNPLDETIKDALKQHSTEEITEFFERHFLCKLTNQLDTDEQTPAEIIRQRRKQTIVIRNYLLTFRSK